MTGAIVPLAIMMVSQLELGIPLRYRMSTSFKKIPDESEVS